MKNLYDVASTLRADSQEALLTEDGLGEGTRGPQDTLASSAYRAGAPRLMRDQVRFETQPSDENQMRACQSIPQCHGSYGFCKGPFNVLLIAVASFLSQPCFSQIGTICAVLVVATSAPPRITTKSTAANWP